MKSLILNIATGVVIVALLAFGVVQRFAKIKAQDAQAKNTFLAIKQKEGVPVSVITLQKKNLITRVQITAVSSGQDLKAWVERRDLDKLRVHQPWQTSPEVGNQNLRGVVTSVNHSADLNTGLFIVGLRVTSGEVEKNSAIAVDVDTGLIKDALVVPIEVITLHKGLPYIFVVKDQKALRRPVTLRAYNNSEAAIIGDIAEGDQVIFQGAHSITDGAAIHIVSYRNMQAEQGADQ